MALLRLDAKNLTLNLQVGVLEEYKPDRELKNIHKKLETIKADAEKELARLTGEDLSMEQMKERLAEDKQLEEKWKAYLATEFTTELQKLVKRINKKNEKICPGYKERTQQNS